VSGASAASGYVVRVATSGDAHLLVPGVSYLFADDQRARLKAAEDLLDAGTIQILQLGVESG
jgi:hypothetical protein